MEVFRHLAWLGHGSYGDVQLCEVSQSVAAIFSGGDSDVDSAENVAAPTLIALKTWRQAHHDSKVMRIALREIQVLKGLKHPNIIKLQCAFRTPSGRVCMAFDYGGKSTHQLLESRCPAGVPHPLLKQLAFQLIQAVRYLHSLKVLHRDIKPANVLVDSAGVLRLCDFGFARCTSLPGHARAGEHLTPYVITRWYRAPEVLVGMPYGAAADIWSLGATLAELATGEPLLPGQSSLDQLHRIARTVGPLPGHLTAGLRRELRELLQLSSDDPTAGAPAATTSMAPGFGAPCPGAAAKPTPLRRRLGPRLAGPLLELLEACLRTDPRARPTADDLLHMPYFLDAPRLFSGHSLERFYAQNGAYYSCQPPPQCRLYDGRLVEDRLGLHPHREVRGVCTEGDSARSSTVGVKPPLEVNANIAASAGRNERSGGGGGGGRDSPATAASVATTTAPGSGFSSGFSSGTASTSAGGRSACARTASGLTMYGSSGLTYGGGAGSSAPSAIPLASDQRACGAKVPGAATSQPAVAPRSGPDGAEVLAESPGPAGTAAIPADATAAAADAAAVMAGTSSAEGEAPALGAAAAAAPAAASSTHQHGCQGDGAHEGAPPDTVPDAVSADPAMESTACALLTDGDTDAVNPWVNVAASSAAGPTATRRSTKRVATCGNHMPEPAANPAPLLSTDPCGDPSATCFSREAAIRAMNAAALFARTSGGVATPPGLHLRRQASSGLLPSQPMLPPAADSAGATGQPLPPPHTQALPACCQGSSVVALLAAAPAAAAVAALAAPAPAAAAAQMAALAASDVLQSHYNTAVCSLQWSEAERMDVESGSNALPPCFIKESFGRSASSLAGQRLYHSQITLPPGLVGADVEDDPMLSLSGDNNTPVAATMGAGAETAAAAAAAAASTAEWPYDGSPAAAALAPSAAAAAAGAARQQTQWRQMAVRCASSCRGSAGTGAGAADGGRGPRTAPEYRRVSLLGSHRDGIDCSFSLYDSGLDTTLATAPSDTTTTTTVLNFNWNSAATPPPREGPEEGALFGAGAEAIGAGDGTTDASAAALTDTCGNRDGRSCSEAPVLPPIWSNPVRNQCPGTGRRPVGREVLLRRLRSAGSRSHNVGGALPFSMVTDAAADAAAAGPSGSVGGSGAWAGTGDNGAGWGRGGSFWAGRPAQELATGDLGLEALMLVQQQQQQQHALHLWQPERYHEHHHHHQHQQLRTQQLRRQLRARSFARAGTGPACLSPGVADPEEEERGPQQPLAAPPGHWLGTPEVPAAGGDPAPANGSFWAYGRCGCGLTAHAGSLAVRAPEGLAKLPGGGTAAPAAVAQHSSWQVSAGGVFVQSLLGPVSEEPSCRRPSGDDGSRRPLPAEGLGPSDADAAGSGSRGSRGQSGGSNMACGRAVAAQEAAMEMGSGRNPRAMSSGVYDCDGSGHEGTRISAGGGACSREGVRVQQQARCPVQASGSRCGGHSGRGGEDQGANVGGEGATGPGAAAVGGAPRLWGWIRRGKKWLKRAFGSAPQPAGC